MQNKWRAIFSARARDRLDIGGNLGGRRGGGGGRGYSKVLNAGLLTTGGPVSLEKKLNKVFAFTHHATDSRTAVFLCFNLKLSICVGNV